MAGSCKVSVKFARWCLLAVLDPRNIHIWILCTDQKLLARLTFETDILKALARVTILTLTVLGPIMDELLHSIRPEPRQSTDNGLIQSQRKTSPLYKFSNLRVNIQNHCRQENFTLFSDCEVGVSTDSLCFSQWDNCFVALSDILSMLVVSPGRHKSSFQNTGCFSSIQMEKWEIRKNKKYWN